MNGNLRPNGRIGWQLEATGAEVDGYISPAEVIVRPPDGGQVTGIVLQYIYDGGDRLLTLTPCDDPDWDFRGEVAIPGQRTFPNLIIHCNRYTHPTKGEQMLFGDWYEKGRYIWWVHWRPIAQGDDVGASIE